MVEMIKNIVNMSDTSAIIKVIFIFVTVVFSIYLAVKGKTLKIEESRQEEEKDKLDNHNSSLEENKQQTAEVQADSQRADDFLKRRK